MPGILAFLPEDRALARLGEAARGLRTRFGPEVRVALTRVVALDQLEPMARRSGASTVVIDVAPPDLGSHQVPVHAAVAWKRARPDIPVLPYFGSGAGVSELAALLDAGISPRSLVRPEHATAHWEEHLFRALSGGMGEVFLSMLPPDIDPWADVIARTLFENIASDPSLETMAGWVGCHHEALRKRLRRAGLPSGQELRMWIRAYRTLRLIELTGAPHEVAASRLGYSGGSHFSDQVLSLVGHRPTELLGLGGSASLLKAFAERLEELRGARPQGSR